MTEQASLSQREQELYLLIARMADEGLEACRGLEWADEADVRQVLCAVWRMKMAATTAKADDLMRVKTA